jgi:hypothetical protein
MGCSASWSSWMIASSTKRKKRANLVPLVIAWRNKLRQRDSEFPDKVRLANVARVAPPVPRCETTLETYHTTIHSKPSKNFKSAAQRMCCFSLSLFSILFLFLLPFASSSLSLRIFSISRINLASSASSSQRNFEKKKLKR